MRPPVDLWSTITSAIAQATNTSPGAPHPLPISGGHINRTYRLSCSPTEDYFVKLNGQGVQGLFNAESEGLTELAHSNSLRTPMPVCQGTTDGQAFLVLEYIPLQSQGDLAIAGTQLAQLHHNTQSSFGWHRDNHIGITPQTNSRETNWPLFWREQRLGPQLALAKHNGFGSELSARGEQLIEQLPTLLDHAPSASLLHGDLWSGNLAYDATEQPVIFDPAVYYGDREADLAMTELFGGFGERFYAAYRECWALADGYSVRKQLYNLYHILNHLNLFGTGYLEQAKTMIDQLLAEVRA